MYLAYAGAIIFFVALACGLIVFFSRPFSSIKLVWGLFCLAVVGWAFGLYEIFSKSDISYNEALYWSRFLNYFALPEFNLEVQHPRS